MPRSGIVEGEDRSRSVFLHGSDGGWAAASMALFEGERGVAVVFVSLRLPERVSPVGVLVGDDRREFQLTGLKVSSVVRLDKVATVLKSLGVGEIGGEAG
jgi:hypothetical protein